MTNHRQPLMTPEERRAYRKYVNSAPASNTAFMETVPQLSGSDEYFDQDENKKDQSVKPKSFVGRLLGIRLNAANLITALICGVVILILTWLFGINADIHLLKYRVDEIQVKIESINTDYVSKEHLILRLDNIKLELKSLIPDVDEINGKMDNLESEIELIKNK